MRFLLFLASLIPAISYAKDINIVTWNAREIFSNQDIIDRKSDFRKLYKDLNPSVLLIQEITSCSNLSTIKKVVGKASYYSTCTDYNPDNSNKYSSFEVGIISKYPISDIIEYDQSLDNGEDTEATESYLRASPHIDVSDTSVYRGFLSAKIEALNLFVNVVHLKSSRGKVGIKDKLNAEQREYVAASIASTIAEQQSYYPEYTYLVAGDFNVGHSDKKKNGVSLTHDCYKHCGDNDRYDETHALLEGGLVPGIEMNNLTYGHKTSTYPRFKGTPIDNIYVQGPNADSFTDVSIGDNTYGSDHLPVLTTFSFDESATVEPPSSNALSSVNEESLSGIDLRRHLKAVFFDGKHKSLGYNEARIQMYSYVDKAPDGNIYGVYTGYSQPAKAVSFLNPINAEHTVPQSWFNKRNPMKSDIHHLFPTHKTPNNKRGSYPFGETANPTKWLGTKNGAYTETKKRPQVNEASYSEFVHNTLFEPPESHKGNVARALAYFYTMYPNEAGDMKKVFYQGNMDLLAEWHLNDPVDSTEIERNKRIKEVQGNSNPYIEDPGLICRAWELMSCR